MVERRPGTREPAMAVKGSKGRSLLAVQRRRRTERRDPLHQQAEEAGKLDRHHAPARYSRALQSARRRGHDPMRALLPHYAVVLPAALSAHESAGLDAAEPARLVAHGGARAETVSILSPS